MTKALVEWLAAHPFNWKDANVEGLAAAAGFVRSERTEHRTSFVKDGLFLVAYHPDGDIGWVDVELWNHAAPEDEKAYHRVEKAIEREYRDALLEMGTAAGPAAFEGTLDDAGFPEDQDAVRLAQWNKAWGRLLLKSQHEGREMPLTLVVTLAR